MAKAANANKRQQKEALSIEQLNAIDLLVMGKTDREVAEAVGVHRCTVTSWRLYNPYFQAELNRRRKEVWGAAVDRFRSLTLKALDTVEKALEQGDAKTAVDILKMAGLDMGKDGSLGTYLVGETEAEKIVEELAERKRREEMYRVTPPPTDWEKQSVLRELQELEELARRLEALQARSGA